MSAPSIQAVVFDAYGTLFDVAAVTQACSAVFPAQGDVLSQLWRAKQLEYSWLVSLMDQYVDFWELTHRALAYALSRLGLSADEDARARMLAGYWTPRTYPDVFPALDALADWPLAILSNGAPGMLAAAVDGAGMGHLLAAVLSADQVRVYKPSPRGYGLACRHLGIPEPAKVAFVSASPFDIAGAKAFGMRTLWLDRAGGRLELLGPVPDAHLTSLNEVAERVRSP